VEHPSGHTAEKSAGDRAVAARADHDQIGVDGVGEGDDLVGGKALEQLGLDVDALFSRKLDGLVQECPIVFVELMRERRREVAEAAIRHDIDNWRDVDDVCLCMLFGREV